MVQDRLWGFDCIIWWRESQGSNLMLWWR